MHLDGCCHQFMVYSEDFMFDDEIILFFSKNIEIVMIIGINILLTVVGVAIFLKRILKEKVSEIKTRLNFLNDKMIVIEDRFANHISDNKKVMIKLSEEIKVLNKTINELSGEMKNKLSGEMEIFNKAMIKFSREMDHKLQTTFEKQVLQDKQDNKQSDHGMVFPRPKLRGNDIHLSQSGGRGKKFDLEYIDVRLENLERKVDLFFE